MATGGEYFYEIITDENDAREAAKLIADIFSKSNMITVFDCVSSQLFYDAVAWPMMNNSFRKNNSILVRCRSTGEIVAATTAEDLFIEHTDKLNNNVTNPIAVNDLLDELDELFINRDLGEELKVNMILHIGLSAVSTEHSGKGIAYQMGQFLANRAKEKGFQYLLVQTTNPATRYIYLNKMNGKEVTIIDPTTWLWKQSPNEELTYPYKNYEGGIIPNILIKL